MSFKIEHRCWEGPILLSPGVEIPLMSTEISDTPGKFGQPKELLFGSHASSLVTTNLMDKSNEVIK